MKKTLLFLTVVLCFSTLLGQRMNKILYFGHLYVESGINVSDISPIIQLKPIVGDYADGILGIDNLGGKVITIDYLNEQMAFEDQLGGTEGFASIPIRYENRRIYVPLTVTISEGKIIEGEGLMDLGSKEYIGIVGNDFWERFDMIIDLPGKRLFLKPNTKFNDPFESPVRGFSYTDRSRTLGYWVVNSLAEESNAEKAGLRNGDRIVAVNGRDVKGISLEERKTFFDGMTEITLTIQRDHETVEISFPFDEPKL